VRVFNEINRRILIDLLVNAAFNWATIGVIAINSLKQEESRAHGNYTFVLIAFDKRSIEPSMRTIQL